MAELGLLHDAWSEWIYPVLGFKITTPVIPAHLREEKGTTEDETGTGSLKDPRGLNPSNNITRRDGMGG